MLFNLRSIYYFLKYNFFAKIGSANRCQDVSFFVHSCEVQSGEMQLSFELRKYNQYEEYCSTFQLSSLNSSNSPVITYVISIERDYPFKTNERFYILLPACIPRTDAL